MTQLKCDVIHCISNRDNRCCRPDIRVGGNEATECQQTCCESFRPIAGGASNVTNAVDYSHVNEAMPIHCDATNCVYNKQRNCMADAIQVVGRAAEKMEQTACETFKCSRDCGCQSK